MLRREALAMRSLCHPNVVQILGVVLDHHAYVAILLELAEFGSLRDMMDDHAPLLLRRPDAQLRLALQIAQGMAFLHSRKPPVLHHDLKSANVLLFAGPAAAADAADAADGAAGLRGGAVDGEPCSASPAASAYGLTAGQSVSSISAGQSVSSISAGQSVSSIDELSVGRLCAKLCDFGLASGHVGDGIGMTALQTTRRSHNGGGTGGGTLAYTAPEAFAEEYALPSEVYSYGILIWELLTCEVPWAAPAANGRPYVAATLMHAVCHGTRPPLPKGVAESVLGGLAQRCWHASPTARPDFNQVVVQVQLGLRQSMIRSTRGWERLRRVQGTGDRLRGS